MSTNTLAMPCPPVRLVAGLATAVLLIVTACTPDVSGDDGNTDSGDDGDDATVTIAIGDSLDSLDPAQVAAFGGQQVRSYLYDTLTREDPETLEAEPGLAESWEVTKTHMSFTLWEHATCSDGTPVTAETVARNLERMKDPETNAPLTLAYFGSTDYVVTFDDAARTVDVELTVAQPFLELSVPLGSLGIVCGAGLEDPSILASEASGSGPYTLVEHVAGDHVTVERRDDYAWGPDGVDIESLPKTVIFDLTADSNTQANLVLGGDLQAAQLTGEVLARFENEDGFTRQDAGWTPQEFVFNQRDGLITANEPVRVALSQAIDRAELGDIQTQGTGEVANTLRAEAEVCVDAETTGAAVPTGGIDAARATLEAAGWTLGSGGVYERDGQSLTIRFLAFDLTTAAAEYVRSTWADLGVDVQLDTRDPSQATSALFAGTEWDASIIGASTDTPTGLTQLFSGRPSPEGGNFGALDNQTYNEEVGLGREIGGDESCPHFIAAETALVEHADVVPVFATVAQWVIADGTSFANSNVGYIDPFSVRQD